MKLDTKNTQTKVHKDISFDKKRKDKHVKELGYKIPEDYFLNSKNQILAETVAKNRKTRVVKLLSFSAVAAVVALLFTAINVNNNTTADITINDEESKVLISSLFMNDKKIEALSDSYMLEDLYDETNPIY
ncbi:hypothetical protein FHR24_001554 [Wenyingzhuangia heitensis]|uniref:Uncharacterized protein n=1 Tax=Wenyingzhuangia heitensis TaxID=1487859 RepID=A0ABX0UBA9_9FLAO|nr:hypothetical protein [Wenyingzhuangia heitensis]NIJ45115.1 hypothetical protein [Wenyingzhuangia heitensis]